MPRSRTCPFCQRNPRVSVPFVSPPQEIEQRERIRNGVDAESDYLTAVVDGDGNAVISPECPEILDLAISPNDAANLLQAYHEDQLRHFPIGRESLPVN